MLILILVLTLSVFVTFLVLYVKNPYRSKYDYSKDVIYMVMCWLFGSISVGIIIAICCLTPEVATESVIDSKIAMYQEENANIEQDIDKIIQGYLVHEHDTFADLKTEESSITLVTIFPELKSDTLVQKQVKIYVANNANIKDLREEKIELAKIRWILYFGR